MVDGKQCEIGLSPAGIEQSERLRDRLQTSLIAPDVVLSSPAQRAIETAAILKPALKKPIQEEEMLVEWRADPDSRLSDEEFGQQWQTCPEAQKPFFRFVPEGETWLEFSKRVQTALNHILQEHAGQTIAIGTHGGVIQASLLYFFGTSGAVMPRERRRGAYVDHALA